MGEFAKAEGLEMTGQGCYHAQQQLRKVLCLDFYVRLLEVFRKTEMSEIEGICYKVGTEILI